MTAHKQHADVGAEKIEASFKQGVLAVTPPKKPAARKPKKKTEVKAAIY